MVGEPGPKGDPLTHPRLMIRARGRASSRRTDPDRPALRDRWLQRSPEVDALHRLRRFRLCPAHPACRPAERRVWPRHAPWPGDLMQWAALTALRSDCRSGSRHLRRALDRHRPAQVDASPPCAPCSVSDIGKSVARRGRRRGDRPLRHHGPAHSAPARRTADRPTASTSQVSAAVVCVCSIVTGLMIVNWLTPLKRVALEHDVARAA